ncbi:endolytic transglycosylase MltG [Cognatiyoonia sp. IB215446]|uniref:endolytic transglycosylase MltG n=1 Tax=Cognatiyoonia sp. IB215446 TaxID=3097355 RepID=UPI002A163C44|nr:endolytic transglycosylase MltG [Cognatiyoonia sp. IB215446]MDX8349649.1 endolytic transglycosylase MltG [Cognatiyoonia sp. IB215446]
MWRHIASNAMTFLIVALFLMVGAVAWGTREYSASGPLEAAICLEVPSGGTFGGLSNDLIEEGAITSAFIFETGADYTDKAGDLKAGRFRVPESASMEEIVDIVTRGGRNTCGTEVIYRVGITRTLVDVRELDPATNQFREIVSFDVADEEIPSEYTEVRGDNGASYRIVVAEGATSWQVANALSQLDVLRADVTDTPSEGFLAPGDYDVSAGDAVSAVVERMRERQEENLRTAWQNRADGLPLASADEALVLASIIEKETSVPDERRQVASVFVNRLNRGMRLQTDPTVIYGITRGEGVLGRGLRQSELRAATPWNTYVIEGLPPTPIANPGRASIEAALNPDTTDYIFFVADGTGGHAFATNLDDHNRNVARWREIEAQRANDG